MKAFIHRLCFPVFVVILPFAFGFTYGVPLAENYGYFPTVMLLLLAGAGFSIIGKLIESWARSSTD